MKRTIITLLLLIGTAISAHEFWLQPQRFYLHKGETLTLKFLVGEDFSGENWKGNRSSVEKLKLFYNEIQDDLTTLLPDSVGSDSLKLQFYDEGTAMIGYQSANKFVNLDSTQFLEYLKEDGIKNAVAYREEHHETGMPGRELYQRVAKTIFQVGDRTDDSYKKTYGFPTEFVPLDNPYALKKGESFRIRILVDGVPASGLLVKTWHRTNGKTVKSELLSDQDGIVKFPVSQIGKWMVSNVRMVRIDNNPEADWQSFWASLTWGY